MPQVIFKCFAYRNIFNTTCKQFFSKLCPLQYAGKKRGLVNMSMKYKFKMLDMKSGASNKAWNSITVYKFTAWIILKGNFWVFDPQPLCGYWTPSGNSQAVKKHDVHAAFANVYIFSMPLTWFFCMVFFPPTYLIS